MNENTIYPPLCDLQVSASNVRRVAPTGIEELAALIASQGLLQNLVVTPALLRGTGGYRVIAGGRRLRALQLLAERGDLDRDYPVPCIVVDDANAEAASLAENSAREPMHPADEFEAFKRMHDAGEPVEDIAAAFGVSPIVVQRRLKLANVSPNMIALYRAGEMRLDQVTALSITDDHKRQEQVWNKAEGYERQAGHLRDALTKGMIGTTRDAAARFVGLNAYEAAGGTVTRDLFGAPDEGYMADANLLERLFNEKLEATAAALRAEGWSWVVAQKSVSYNDVYKFGRSKATTRELTGDEESNLQLMTARRDWLADEIERLEEAGEYDAIRDLDDEREQLEEKIVAMKSGLETYSDRQKKKAGVLIGLSYAGVLEIHRGLIRPEDKPRDKGEAAGSEAPAAKPAHSESLTRRLSAHRTAAMQAHLAECPRLALNALCATLAAQVFYGLPSYTAGAIKVTANDHTSNLKLHADDIEGSRAWTTLHELRTDLQKALPESADGLLEWFEDQPLELVMEVLAFCTASCIDAVQHHETSSASQPGADIAACLGLDMSGWWQPTAAAYFKHVRKDIAIAAMVDAGAENAEAECGSMKKGAIDNHAELQLRDSGWLPTILRGPEVTKPKAAKKFAEKKVAPARKVAAKPPVELSAMKHDPLAVAWPFPSGVRA